jgi:hypothetical protein
MASSSNKYCWDINLVDGLELRIEDCYSVILSSSLVVINMIILEAYMIVNFRTRGIS